MWLQAIGLASQLFTAGKSQFDANKDASAKYDSLEREKNNTQKEFDRNTAHNSPNSPATESLLHNTRKTAEKAFGNKKSMAVAGNNTFAQQLAAMNATNNAVDTTYNNVVAQQEARQQAEDQRYLNAMNHIEERGQAYKQQEEQANANQVSNSALAIGMLANNIGADIEGKKANATTSAPVATGTEESKPSFDNTDLPKIEAPTTEDYVNQLRIGLSGATQPVERKSNGGAFKWLLDAGNMSVANKDATSNINNSSWNWNSKKIKNLGAGNYYNRVSNSKKLLGGY